MRRAVVSPPFLVANASSTGTAYVIDVAYGEHRARVNSFDLYY
jgi:hypothetical protein